MKEIICRICGKSFLTSVNNKQVCDDKHIFNCSMCGKPVEINTRELRTYYIQNKETWCSRSCKTKLTYKHKNKHKYEQLGVSIEEVKTLYETTSLSKQDICDKIGITYSQLDTIIHNEGFTRSEELIKDMRQNSVIKNKQTKLERYGDENYCNAKKISETKRNWSKEQKEQFREKYKNIVHTEEWNNNISKSLKNMDKDKRKLIQLRTKQTLLERYGDENYHNVEQFRTTMTNRTEEQKQLWRDKISKSHIGVSAHVMTPEVKNKIRQSVLKTLKNTPKDVLQDRTKRMKHTWKLKSRQQIENILSKTRNTRHKNNSFKNAQSVTGRRFDSSYEAYVYDYCIRNNIPIETQIPLKFNYNGEEHITYIDFKIDGILFECKGGHLLHGTYGYALKVPIEQKLEIYKQNNVILITDELGGELIPSKESKYSNGLKYLDKCPNPLIGVDIDLFKEPKFPYRNDKPKCFYKVSVSGQRSMLEAWTDEELRWKMIKNRILYVGGFIDSRSILTAMNVTKTCKQPSWFDKKYAKDLINKYITSNTVIDPFAGWGTRYDACIELGLAYYGCDLNEELVKWHKQNNRNIVYGDANNFKYDKQCSVFICPPYRDIEIYFKGQDVETTECQWLEKVMKNIPNAKEYLMVCKVVDPGWEKYIVEEKVNKSHLGTNKEYVLLIKN